ncbi:hypothetical protein RchiOBHm_Chr4g0425471 [Rosa chinensis]|uniref:Uncharacterized protein n=1 Tax=Rosa chinensis TaxID=74649 RepID=A0A2P6QZ50_ROSCH|nr:hypothetical protein RchiOBHm_Chr4g0425471 [Rosa chinensis]
MPLSQIFFFGFGRIFLLFFYCSIFLNKLQFCARLGFFQSSLWSSPPVGPRCRHGPLDSLVRGGYCRVGG